jgi:minor extracellular serine protease Vpr
LTFASINVYLQQPSKKTTMFRLTPVLFSFTFCFNSLVFSQAKYDASVKRFLFDLKREDIQKPSDAFRIQYDITVFHGELTIGALAQVNNNDALLILRELGVYVVSNAGSIYTLRIPLNKVDLVLGVSGIARIEIGSSLSLDMERELQSARVDSVHNNWGDLLDQPYFGTGVVVGIIDWGFDYTHPNFYDTTLTNMRLVRAWDQNKESGPNPALYGFGTEYVGSAELLAAQEDTLYVFGPGSHGTHVAGIAGGSGSGQIPFGVAPDAELIFISLKRDAPSLIDGFNYIKDYAESQGKPWVVNMSFGSHIGPHDGSSLHNMGIDNLHGPGAIFVGSAGNNGSNNFHLDKDFSQNSDTLFTVVGFNNSVAEFGQTLSMWGSANSSFKVALRFTDGSNNTVYETPFYWTSDEPEIIDTLDINGNQIIIRVTGVSAYETNDKPSFLIDIRNTSSLKTVLVMHSDDSHVHMWNIVRMNNRYTNWGVNFTNNYPNAVAGNYNYGLGEPAGVGNNVIAVGSYKAEQWNAQGTSFVFGDISSFSSRGPTVDERIKPDISSTGQDVLSSINSFDPTNQSGLISPFEFQGRTYGFKRLSGTSMSGPMVTGIVALMLEANPLLSASGAKEILKMTARLDQFTGGITYEDGHLQWGWGKANAMAAVIAAQTFVGVDEVTWVEQAFSLFPNPTANSPISIQLSENLQGRSDLVLYVYDMSGNRVQEIALSSEANQQLNLGNLQAGAYLFQLRGPAVFSTFTLVKID